MKRETDTRRASLSRRAFSISFGASALVLCLRIPIAGSQEPVRKYGAEALAHGVRDDPRVFVGIDTDGIVTFVCHRAEMGQGVRTSLAMVVADELEADWERVKVVQATGDEEVFGNQDTDGSRSMRHHFLPMRRIGAGARQMLESAAAQYWAVPVSEVRAKNHEVIHTPSGRKLGYGTLSAVAATLPVPKSVKLKRPEQFRYIGRTIASIDGHDITTGRAKYGIDAHVQGMLHAVIARPPVYGGMVSSFDAAAAEQVPGVVKILSIGSEPLPSEFQPLGGVAVIGTSTWAAIKGRDRLSITWEDGPNAAYASDAYRTKQLVEAKKPGKVVRTKGDVDTALAGAPIRIAADYYIPHQAHAAMEPPVALARIVDGVCEIWAGVQTPQIARDRVARTLGLEPRQVVVRQTLLGGGFGRKSQPDFVIEAALLSKAMNGRPVQVLWTREDDLQNDYFGTVSLEHLEGAVDEKGRPLAWLHRSLAPSITTLFGPDSKRQAPFELGQGLIDAPFDVPHLRIENGRAAAHTRIGWFRSVSNLPHAFAAQSFVSELAAAAGRDPKDFLLDLIGPPRVIDPADISSEWWNYTESPQLYAVDTARLRHVVETVALASGWGRLLGPGQGLGIAAHRSFGSYAAAVVEVLWTPQSGLIIPRVDIAIDCGPQINPDRIRSQMEGAVIQGISIASVSDISFKDGRPEQTNFHSFQLTRIDAAPKDIRVHLVPAKSFDEPLGGVGEPGLPPVPPALTNAVFAATGKRIRMLPIGDQLGT